MNADVKKEQKFKSRCSEGDDWRFPAVTCGGFHFKENMYSYKYRNKADLNKDLLWLKYAIKYHVEKHPVAKTNAALPRVTAREILSRIHEI